MQRTLLPHAAATEPITLRWRHAGWRRWPAAPANPSQARGSKPCFLQGGHAQLLPRTFMVNSLSMHLLS